MGYISMKIWLAAKYLLLTRANTEFNKGGRGWNHPKNFQPTAPKVAFKGGRGPLGYL